jgi:hypothetical protein
MMLSLEKFLKLKQQDETQSITFGERNKACFNINFHRSNVRAKMMADCRVKRSSILTYKLKASGLSHVQPSIGRPPTKKEAKKQTRKKIEWLSSFFERAKTIPSFHTKSRPTTKTEPSSSSSHFPHCSHLNHSLSV